MVFRTVLVLFIFFFGFLIDTSQIPLSNIQQYLGKKIQKIIFTGNHHVTGLELERTITLKVGMPLTADLINTNVKLLFQETYFSYVQVEAKSVENGVDIYFHLKEISLVEKISFINLKKINEQEVLDTLPLKEQKVYKEFDVIQSVRFLLEKYKSLGYYGANIRYRLNLDEKTNLMYITFIVDIGESIYIHQINILGVKSFPVDKIKAFLTMEEKTLFSKGSFSKTSFLQDQDNILNFYLSRGYLDVKLVKADWFIHRHPQKLNKRVISIKFEVEEGKQYFFGGYYVDWDPEQIFSEDGKPIFKLKEFYKYFTYTLRNIGDYLNKVTVEQDRGIISYLYSQRGYIYSQVVLYKTVFLLNEESLQEQENKHHSNFMNFKRLRKLLHKKPQLYNKTFVHFHFSILEGEKGYIENVIIKGNTKTKTHVIRRELLVKSGDLFSAVAVQRSRERIANLQYFKSVSIDARPGSTYKQLNLIIEVEEQPTGTINLGGGYGTTAGFSIFTDISEKNLLGTGRYISGKVEYGPRRAVLQLTYREPWILNKPLFWSLSVFLRRVERVVGAFHTFEGQRAQEEAIYNVTTVGFSMGISHRFLVNWQHYHQIAPSFSRRTNPSNLVSDSVFRLVERGWQLKNTMINGFIFDNRDNYFNPTFGGQVDIGLELTGSILGGHDHYLRYTGSFLYYWWPTDYTFFGLIRNNTLRRWRIVLEHRLSVAFTQQTKSIYTSQSFEDDLYIDRDSRLEIGGYEDLRGWLPYDIYFPYAWRQFGGSHKVAYSLELRIPLEPSLLWLVVFFDSAAMFIEKKELFLPGITSESILDSIEDARLTSDNLTLNYFKYSWGLGVRVQLPILPLRLYLAQRLEWDNESHWFKPVPTSNDFQFVFGLGDERF